MTTKTREPILCDDRPITKDQLPAAAKAFIKKFFSAATIATITMDKELLGRSYEVTMDCGAKLEFDKEGEWDNIECPRAQIPAAILPLDTRHYLTDNYPGCGIKGLEQKRRGYEVELENGLELKFDKDGLFVKVDD